MTDDQTQSYDDAESAATPESNGTPIAGSGPAGASAAGRSTGSHAAGRPRHDDLNAAGSDADIPGADVPGDVASAGGPSAEEAQASGDAEQIARRARSARPTRRAQPLASASGEDDAAPEASMAPAPRRPVRRTTEAVTPVQQEPTGDEPLVPAPGAALRPRRRPQSEAGAELATTGDTGRRRVSRKQRAAQRPVAAREFEQEHVSPATFVRQSVGELRKVVWPSGQQLGEYFVVVLAFVLFIIAFVGLLDLFFGWGLLKLLGK